MLNLSELTFKVNTDALVQAAEKIAVLGKSVESLQGSFSKLEKGAAASEKALAEVNIKNAQAAKANAEAALLQAKTTTEVEKAERAREKAIQSTTKATEEQTKSVSTSVSVLQRQSDIYGFMIEGFSKGQSSILATAKAAGIAAEEMKNLQDVLQAQRTIMGGDPFDKSLGSLKSLQNEFKVLKEVQRLYTAEIPLTRKQMENLALDKLRLVEAMKVQGKSFSEIKAELQNLNAEYIATAGSINRLVQAENQIDKAHKDTANANAYLEKEMQRVNYALQTQNNELNKGTANALFRFEQNLKRSGLTLAEQKKMLDDYRTSLLALEKAKGSTQTDYISRALGPQITDIFVGLATGQSPLTVMLQQGGQLRDQLAQAGVAAEDMGDTMRTAARSMVTSVAAVAGAFKDLLVGAFLDTGKGITDLTMRMTGLNAVFEATRNRLLANGGLMGITPTSVRALDVFKNFVEFLAGGSLAVGVGTMIALGAAMVQVIRENDKMAVQLGLTGAAMGLTFDSAQDMSKGMQNIGVSTSDAMKVLSAMAKEGKFVAEEIRTVTKAAIDLNTYGGVAIEDTIKQFAKMKEKPVESLLELSKATGLVSVEVIKSVIELEDQGRTADATAKAIEELARVNDEQVERMKKSYNGFSLFMINLGKGISKFFSDAFKDLFYASSPTEQLKKQLKAVDETLANWGTMNMDIAGVVQAMIPGEKERVQLQRTQLLNQIALLDLERQQYEADQKSKQEKIAMLGLEQDVTDEIDKQNLKRSKKKDTLADFTSNFIEVKIKDAAKARNLDVATIRNNEELIESYRKLAKAEWEASQKQPKKDPSENYYATLLRDSTNATIKADEATQDLTKSQLKMLEVINDPRFAKLSEERQTTVLRNYAVAASNEKVVEGQELINKLLGKGEGLGKEYYATLAKLESLKGNAGIDQEQLEKALQALRDTTPEAKRVREEIKAAAEAYNQYSANAIASLESTKIGNQQLDYRLSVLGKSTDEQRKMKIQQDASVKLMQAEVKYAKEVLKIRQDTKLQNDPKLMAKALQEAENAYAEERKLINREVAVEAAEDFQKEFDRISGGVTDSIVTALFEGGKSGSKKLRDLVVAELKKPVTMVVTAVVNTMLGNIVGALGFGSSGSSSTSNGGGNVFDVISNGFSALNGGIATGISNAFSKFAGSSVGQSLGLSNSTAIVGNNPSAYVPEGGQLTSLGQNIGTAVRMVGSGLAGYGISSAVSGGYTTGGNTVNVLAGVASAFLGPLAGVIGGAVNRAFGRKLADSGIQGSFGTQDGFSGESYQFYKGGWFRSDKTKTSEMDAALTKTLDTAFTQMITQVGTLGTVLGLSTDRLKDFNTTFKISFQGLQESEIQGKIQEALATANNEMAEQILGTWSKTTKEVTDVIEWRSGTGEGEFVSTFENTTRVVEEVSYTASSFAREGEKAIDTLTRLATSITLVNSTFEGLGYSLYEASLQGGDFASKLIDLFGGNDNFAALTNSYYENFYSEQEKTALLTKQLTKEFGKFNEAIPTTKAEFKAIVDKQDLLTDSGRESFAKLLGLQTPLLNLFDLLEKAAGGAANSVKELSSSVIDEINRLRGYTDTSGNNPKTLIAEFDRLTTLARGGDANAFNSLGDASKLLDEYYKSTATSAVQYAYQRSVLANSLEQSYNTVKAGGATFSGTSSLMGTSTLSTPVVSSVSSANAVGSSELLSAVVTELAMLRAAVEADVVHNAKTAKILERVTPEGDALATRNEG